MKALNKTVWLVVALTGILFFSYRATESWRAPRGWTLSAALPSEFNAKQELRRYDAKLRPVAERREKLREQLQRSQVKERELSQNVSEALRRFDDSKRGELRGQFESGALSAENQNAPEIAILYARYREAAAVRRHTTTLRETLAKYEYELTRAFVERERLKERVETIAALGFDPDADQTLDKTERYRALDELTAQTDAGAFEARNETLEVKDVVGKENADSEFASEMFEGAEFTNEPTEDYASAEFDELYAKWQERNEENYVADLLKRLNLQDVPILKNIPIFQNASHGQTVRFDKFDFIVAESLLALVLLAFFAVARKAAEVRDPRESLTFGKLFWFVLFSVVCWPIGVVMILIRYGWPLILRAAGLAIFVYGSSQVFNLTS